MSERAEAKPAATPGATAGALLRQARQAQGLHIAALAAAIKVTPRKLEMLETDRYDELPDATFTRALAQTVCRSLKIDAAPVLALLPQPKGHHRLEHVSEGLNEPFRERPGRLAPDQWASLAGPAVWAPLLILIAAAVLYLLPEGWLKWPPPFSRAASAVPAPQATSDSAASPAAVSTVAATLSAADLPAVAVAGALQVRASAASWVEVLDAHGQPLFSRLLQPGETVGVDGEAPLKVRIGNAAVTQLVFRGQPLELAPFTRENVARLELK